MGSALSSVAKHGHSADSVKGASKGSGASSAVHTFDSAEAAGLSGVHRAGDFDSSAARYLIHGNKGSYDSDQDELPPIPIEWIIAPRSVSPDQCPTVGATVASFVVSDLLSGLVAVFICCRPVIKKLSFGFLGRLPDKNSRCCSSVWYSWLFSFAMSFLGNLFSSLAVVNTEGYGHLSFATVFALYASRPRINMLLLSVLRSTVTMWTSDGMSYAPVKKEELEKQQTAYSGSSASTQENDDAEKLIPKSTHVLGISEEEYVYVDSYRSTFVAEMLLHILSAVFIGVTWGRFPNYEIRHYMAPKTTYMMATPAILAVAAVIAVPVYWRRSRDVGTKWQRALFAVVAFGVVYAAPWVYWHYFLQLPGSLWCPPKLAAQTGIWIVFSAFGNILGY